MPTTSTTPKGKSGPLLDADVNGDGVVNTKDLTETAAANGHSVGTTPPESFPQFQLFAGATAVPGNAVPITQTQVQALLPEAIAAWQAAGLDAADVRRARERAGPGRQPGHEHPGPGSRRHDHDQPDRRGQQLVRGTRAPRSSSPAGGRRRSLDGAGARAGPRDRPVRQHPGRRSHGHHAGSRRASVAHGCGPGDDRRSIKHRGPVIVRRQRSRNRPCSTGRSPERRWTPPWRRSRARPSATAMTRNRLSSPALQPYQ